MMPEESQAGATGIWALAQGDEVVPIPGTMRRMTAEEIELTASDLAELANAGLRRRGSLHRRAAASAVVCTIPSWTPSRPGVGFFWFFGRGQSGLDSPWRQSAC